MLSAEAIKECSHRKHIDIVVFTVIPTALFHELASDTTCSLVLCPQTNTER